MQMAEFDYELAPEFIAQTPANPRDSARLLVGPRAGESLDAISHRHVSDLASLIEPGDVLVVNNTKVLPARLRLQKDTGARCEVLLLEPKNLATGEWEALIRPARKLPPGTKLYAGDDVAVVIGEQSHSDGRRFVQVLAEIARIGEMPLPPYITTKAEDPERYQTVYAQHLGSAAAPTAGLHFTPELLDACVAKGAQLVTVDLTVGLDTFRPVSVADSNDHEMHSEHYSIPLDTQEALRDAKRVIAVGTTSVRALESYAATGEAEGRTKLFITPGYEFHYVDVMLTNFHLPKSTLLLMVNAFAGSQWRELYEIAKHEQYRFLSFGDAMLLYRNGLDPHA